MSGFEFSILGPVEATGGDVALPLGGPRQRALLAYLLLHANRVVAADTLVDELWETPPGDASAALQNQVSRLRKVLGDRLTTKAPGYALRVEPGELDLDRFRAAVAEAGSTSDPAERSRCLREADALYRGSPLAGVEAPFAAGEAAALEELRLAAVEARVDADLERGRHAELVPELGALVVRHPLRERLRGQHILALYRSGRQAEALEAYRDTRRVLDEQLGLEPSPALRELERAILTQDPALAAAAVSSVETQPVAQQDQPAPRRTRVLVAIGVGVVALVLVGAAAAVLLTETGNGHGNITTLMAAAKPVAKKRPVQAATPKRKHTHAARHAAAPVKKVTSAVRPAVPAKVTRPTVHKSPVHKAPVVRPVVHTTPAKTTTTAKQHTGHPTTTTTAPPTAPADTRTLSDDFSETTPNTRLWNVTGNGNGWTWALQNGRLETTIPADAQQAGNYSMVGLGWASQCRFDGDFDERIDYQLLEWPDGVGAHVQISAWVFPSPNASAARQSNGAGEGYSGNIGQNWNVVDTSDMRGTLRLARVDGVDTAYYLSAGKWVALNSQKAPGRVQLGIEVFGANDWTHKEFRVAFDNFSVTAPSVVCP